MPSDARRAVSAPGKVLLAGGYLVLDRAYTALVFGLDARVHVAIEPIRTNAGVTLSEIIVRSPQFRLAAWEYGYRLTEGDAGIAVTQLRASHDSALTRNPFIETALTYALTYITSVSPGTISPTSVSILADQPYYSNRGTPRDAATDRFLDFHVALQDAHKTGLGSSAALVTSFTAALLSYYLPADKFSLDSDDSLRILHNLSQAAHCAAQGKVGSGFDIASAVYGSCLYRRFSPSLLSAVPEPGSASFGTALRTLVQGPSWDTSILKSAIQMPAGLRLVLCDVDCGSQTPGMVKQVLAWRASNRDDADPLWADLQAGNDQLAAELTRLATEGQGNGPDPYASLRALFAGNRALIRKMSAASGVPIEPPQQTALLDACSAVPGVVGGVVPGAGGYDAISLLVEDSEDAVARLKKFLGGWTSEQTAGDAVKIGKVGVLGVREDMVGVRREDPAIYGDWISS